MEMIKNNIKFVVVVLTFVCVLIGGAVGYGELNRQNKVNTIEIEKVRCSNLQDHEKIFHKIEEIRIDQETIKGDIRVIRTQNELIIKYLRK